MRQLIFSWAAALAIGGFSRVLREDEQSLPQLYVGAQPTRCMLPSAWPKDLLTNKGKIIGGTQ